MLGFEDLAVWSRVFRLLDNRVACINQILGCRYACSPSNPCRLLYDSGKYRVTFEGCLVCSFGVYDLPTIDAAFAVVDALADAVWHSRRVSCMA